MAKIHLIIIDPQFDFCATASEGAQLSVAGANKDMERVGNFIRKHKSKIHDIHVTLDSHQWVHIAHPVFWRSPNTGQHPTPFTQITANDIRSGNWTTTRPSFGKYGLKYVESLEKNGRYPLIIWPPHCIIGTPGQSVYQPVRDALREYCEQFATVNYVTKGSNMFTEHYSAIIAEVNPSTLWGEINPKLPMETDPSVLMNVRFLEAANTADKLLICGEAGSHCLANTFRDAASYFKDGSFSKKLVLLTDGTSPVTGFESLQQQFIDELVSQGMETATTDSFIF